MKLHNTASSYNFSNSLQISSKKSEARTPQLLQQTGLSPLRLSSLEEPRISNLHSLALSVPDGSIPTQSELNIQSIADLVGALMEFFVKPESQSATTTAARPTATNARPATATARPTATNARPATARPAAATARPAVTTAKPPATTAKPPATTAKPPATTAKPAAAATTRETGRVAIIEIDPDDEYGHDELVNRIVKTYNPAAPTAVHDNYAGYDISTDPIKSSAQAGSLNRMVDDTAIDVFGSFTKKVNQVVNTGTATVINGSLGLSRNDLYVYTLETLQESPELASQIPGLTKADITSLQTNSEGQTLVPTKVSNAIVKFVDGRLDAKGSAFNRARAAYQKATQNAADKGIAVVVASGNSRDLNEVFPRGAQGLLLGGDTNWLAQSKSVISVAASDDKGTVYKTSEPVKKQTALNDDTIATFSSQGDGVYNPTVAASGVNVLDTQDDGTSFAAPQVAGAVSRYQQLYKKANNKLPTFAQIKKFLTLTARDTSALPREEGAGIFDATKAFDFSFLNTIPQSA